MCVSSGGSGASTDYKDTSEEPIVSKYELTVEQKKENKRRKSLLASKKKKSSSDGGDNTDLGAGSSGNWNGGLSTPTPSSGNEIA
jgi:hypothetical protein